MSCVYLRSVFLSMLNFVHKRLGASRVPRVQMRGNGDNGGWMVMTRTDVSNSERFRISVHVVRVNPPL